MKNTTKKNISITIDQDAYNHALELISSRNEFSSISDYLNQAAYYFYDFNTGGNHNRILFQDMDDMVKSTVELAKKEIMAELKTLEVYHRTGQMLYAKKNNITSLEYKLTRSHAIDAMKVNAEGIDTYLDKVLKDKQ